VKIVGAVLFSLSADGGGTILFSVDGGGISCDHEILTVLEQYFWEWLLSEKSHDQWLWKDERSGLA